MSAITPQIEDVRSVRRFGNKGAHEYFRIRQYDVIEVLKAFVEVLRWAGSALWSKGQP